jgi:glycosyltransferase involved in cell wall biosynthesis
VRILFLDQYSEMGGAQRVLADFLPALQRRGWGVHVAVPGGGPLVGQLRSRNIEVSEIPCGPYRSGTKGTIDLFRFAGDVGRQSRIIRNILKWDSFDLVYVNGPRLLPAAAMAARGRKPLLFHLHYPIHQPFAARFAGWCVRRSDATVIACSISVARSLERFMDARKLQVIRNGTSELAFREREFSGDRGWRIGLVGRISPQKGQIEFLKAAKVLTSEFLSVRFLICGAPLFGAEEYCDRVHSLAAGLPVDFLGWREDVASVLATLDLLVMPSKEEGTPLVLLEAFSAGVPVVAFPAGGIGEVISDRETGFLVCQASPKALAAKIRELLTGDPMILKNIAARARKAWEESYTLAGFHNRITDLAEQVVSSWRAKNEKGARPECK